VVFTVAGGRHVAACHRGLALVSKQLVPGRAYDLHVQAVRMRRRRIVRKGESYSWRVRMPAGD
jgi:hypothetical protein